MFWCFFWWFVLCCICCELLILSRLKLRLFGCKFWLCGRFGLSSVLLFVLFCVGWCSCWKWFLCGLSGWICWVCMSGIWVSVCWLLCWLGCRWWLIIVCCCFCVIVVWLLFCLSVCVGLVIFILGFIWSGIMMVSFVLIVIFCCCEVGLIVSCCVCVSLLRVMIEGLGLGGFVIFLIFVCDCV